MAQAWEPIGGDRHHGSSWHNCHDTHWLGKQEAYRPELFWKLMAFSRKSSWSFVFVCSWLSWKAGSLCQPCQTHKLLGLGFRPWLANCISFQQLSMSFHATFHELPCNAPLASMQATMGFHGTSMGASTSMGANRGSQAPWELMAQLP